MTNRRKNILYSLILFILILTVYFIRDGNGTNASQVKMMHLQGKTMGPITYNVKYFDDQSQDLKTDIDSLLQVFNQSLNTYIPGSEISQFNKDSVFHFDLPFFYKSIEVTKEISEETGGAFNPTIMPLVNFWGFGPNENINIDSSRVDSLKSLVNYDLIRFDSGKVWKLNKNVSLDFSASAKGYGVDVIAEYLENHGFNNYFVEIGGEVRTSGINLDKNRAWRVGVLDPASTENKLFYYATLELSDKAMATSGNYFNYRVLNGVKYSHTISPYSGFPIILPILSATVIADDCMTADALATAFMVMGHEKAIEFLNNNTKYEALLIYTLDNGQIKHYVTDGIEISFQ